MPHRQNKKKHIKAKAYYINATTTGHPGSPLSREELEYYIGIASVTIRVTPTMESDIAREATGIRAYCSPVLSRMYAWAISPMDTSNVTITASIG